MIGTPAGTARHVADALEALMPFVQIAVDGLALRLSGLSGDDFVRECLRLTQAIRLAMEAEGDVGAVEIAVALATLQAATIKAMKMQVGHALRSFISRKRASKP